MIKLFLNVGNKSICNDQNLSTRNGLMKKNYYASSIIMSAIYVNAFKNEKNNSLPIIVK